LKSISARQHETAGLQNIQESKIFVKSLRAGSTKDMPSPAIGQDWREGALAISKARGRPFARQQLEKIVIPVILMSFFIIPSGKRLAYEYSLNTN
jgi:hypothetical protein